MPSLSTQAAPAPLHDRSVAFTGRLASMSRREAWRLVREAGGRPSARVGRRTDLLVVGMHGWGILVEGEASRKLLLAENLRERGHPLKILSETVFLENLGKRPRPTTTPRTCTLERACGLLEVPPEVIRRCDQFGLIRVEAGMVDFQDLVSLRTIVALLRQGLSPAAIARGLDRLTPWLPEMERPLAQARLAADRGELLAELQGIRMNARGQLLFNFGEECPPRGASMPLRKPSMVEEGAEDWFAIALDREDAADPEGAEQAYRRALAVDPGFVEARYNLANLLLQRKRLMEAEIEYRATLDSDPELACAWYNLGYVLVEKNDFPGAATALRKAVALFPEYADAHFNLAICCEELGERAEARRHWQAFLRLQPRGEWAEVARAHLARP